MIRALVAMLVIVACGLALRLAPKSVPDLSARMWLALESRWASLVIGLLTSIAAAYASGSLHRVPVVADEWAYASQATLFAHFRWTGGPLPELFDRIQVRYPIASKYFPGESLMLVPGVWLRAPSLMPIVLTGVVGGGLFAIARRIAGVKVALLTLLYWMSIPVTLYWGGSYMSEVVSGAMWIVTWLCLLQWRDHPRAIWLVGVGLAIGVAAITRPLTAIALCLPAAAFVLVRSRQRGEWRTLVPGVIAGAAVVGIIPVFNARTTGDWRVTPFEQYRRDYIPFDRLGFGLDSTPPRWRLPPDIDREMEQYRNGHRAYTVRALPSALQDRLRRIALDIWPGWRRALMPLAAVGLALLVPESAVGVASFALLVALYLLYWTPPFWTVYYLEGYPVLCFLTVVGGVRLIETLAGSGGRRLVGSALALAAVAGVVGTVRITHATRQQVDADAAVYRRFDATLATLTEPKLLVFVRYGPSHNKYRPLTRNEPDLSTARIWLINDEGAADQELRRLAPDRTAYLFDEATWRLQPLAAE
jgi:hypothetical protein